VRASRTFLVSSRFKLKARGNADKQAIMRRVSFEERYLSGDQEMERREKKEKARRG